ncbi:MAG: FKBP-type peptidyl-prolyl cis-trans isomerase, partial [Sphingomonadales bacterium]|nr:FKBP-type peptidyl-prolyl cis-trans isomerase [Sphingomonadales bacterium]
MTFSSPFTLVMAVVAAIFVSSAPSMAEEAPVAETEYQLAQKQFVDDYAKQDGVIKRPSGLLIKVLSSARGPVPVDTDVVSAHYTGKLIDGTVFDSSVERGVPFEFP